MISGNTTSIVPSLFTPDFRTYVWHFTDGMLEIVLILFQVQKHFDEIPFDGVRDLSIHKEKNWIWSPRLLLAFLSSSERAVMEIYQSGELVLGIYGHTFWQPGEDVTTAAWKPGKSWMGSLEFLNSSEWLIVKRYDKVDDPQCIFCFGKTKKSHFAPFGRF